MILLCFITSFFTSVQSILDLCPFLPFKYQKRTRVESTRRAIMPNFYFKGIPEGDRKFFKFSMRTAKGGQTFNCDYTEITGGTLKQMSNAVKHNNFLLDVPKGVVCMFGELTLMVDVSIAMHCHLSGFTTSSIFAGRLQRCPRRSRFRRRGTQVANNSF